MERKQLHKSVLLAVITLSIASFLYVNVHAMLSPSTVVTNSGLVPCTEMPKPSGNTSTDEDKANNIDTRFDIAFLARLISVVDKALSIR